MNKLRSIMAAMVMIQASIQAEMTIRPLGFRLAEQRTHSGQFIVYDDGLEVFRFQHQKAYRYFAFQLRMENTPAGGRHCHLHAGTGPAFYALVYEWDMPAATNVVIVGDPKFIGEGL
jgi:hypothetical protein